MILQLREVLSHVRVLLASGSPRRVELIQNFGFDLVVKKSGFAENLDVSTFSTAAAYVEETCLLKALFSLVDLTDEERSRLDLIISADTIVVVQEEDAEGIMRWEALGKPRDRTHAIATLKQLSGRSHRVITAFSILVPACAPDGSAASLSVSSGDDHTRAEEARNQVFHTTQSVETQVTFAALSDAEIEAYVDTKEPMDKAGAYGIQALGGLFVSSLQGCYYNVVGLPIHALASTISDLMSTDSANPVHSLAAAVRSRASSSS